MSLSTSKRATKQDRLAPTDLQRTAHELIPGGCHTYAKGDDQYPITAPSFIARGNGCHVWDADGKEYIEYGMGNRAVGLGHAYPSVVQAARDALEYGCNFTRPSPMEVCCAEKLLQFVPAAEMVKFCKDGSDATSGAVRLARAYTGRDKIAICSDHPFFSTDDWFIGTTPVDAGIPEAVKKLTLGFHYNDLASLKSLFAEYPGEIAACMLEPARSDEPRDGFLEGVKALCHENGALLIFDEMITGFRWSNGGGQAVYGVEPDLSCWGKALANGFSVSALAGKREFMRLGGLDHTDKPRVFLLSTTHGAETHALAAAVANMEVYEREPVIEHNYAMGERLRHGFEEAVRRWQLQGYVGIMGRPCCLTFFTFDNDRRPSQAMRSLFLQETIRRGVLMPSLVVSYAHKAQDIDATIDAVDGALEIYAKALADGAEHYLIGRPSQVVYRKYNTADGRAAD